MWLGDNWPGPYVVTYSDDRDRVLCTIVVNGVRSPGEALCIAEAECPSTDKTKSWSIVNAAVAEASHHIGALAAYREKFPPLDLEETPENKE